MCSVYEGNLAIPSQHGPKTVTWMNECKYLATHDSELLSLSVLEEAAMCSFVEIGVEVQGFRQVNRIVFCPFQRTLQPERWHNIHRTPYFC